MICASREFNLRILLTNDDGIQSPGLWAVANALKEVGDLTIVAPDRDQSGMASAMTLLRPLLVEEIPPRIPNIGRVFVVDGTPADCVIIATEQIFEEPFDLVVSGINQGANTGIDVFNSGTFGAAMHGYFRGINAIALSVYYTDEVKYEPAALIGAGLAQSVASLGIDQSVLLNVNLPACDTEVIQGVDCTVLGRKAFLENVEKIQKGRRSYYWIHHNKLVDSEIVEGTDVWSIKNNRVSITNVEPEVLMGSSDTRMDIFRESAIRSLGIS